LSSSTTFVLPGSSRNASGELISEILLLPFLMLLYFEMHLRAIWLVGSIVTAVEEKNGWYRVSAGQEWITKQYFKAE
jgi:hypothetical protein